jgi:hypothetical protein
MEDKQLSKKFIRRAIIIWSAFLAACIGFVLVFGFIDPQALGEVLTFPVAWSSLTGYAVGFCILFLVALMSSFLTQVLLKKRPKSKSKLG